MLIIFKSHIYCNDVLFSYLKFLRFLKNFEFFEKFWDFWKFWFFFYFFFVFYIFWDFFFFFFLIRKWIFYLEMIALWGQTNFPLSFISLFTRCPKMSTKLFLFSKACYIYMIIPDWTYGMDEFSFLQAICHSYQANVDN